MDFSRQNNDAQNNAIGVGPQPIAVPMTKLEPRQDMLPMQNTTLHNDHPEKSTTV